MITYGHEMFIEQAINGVLSQIGDFDLELIISNDCSPDNTDSKIKKILLEHPNASKIKYFNQKNNLGIMPNFYFTFYKCKGNFIAVCEGDDYWIDNFKLQKQINLFNKDKELGLVYTNAKKYIQNLSVFEEIPNRFPIESLRVKNMIESKYIEFATTLFKVDILEKVLDELKNSILDKVIGDTRILLETVHCCKIAYLNDVTTVYRINQGSATQSNNSEHFVFALLDTYKSRREFVFKYNYPKEWLSYSLSNTFKNLINYAYLQRGYKNRVKIVFQFPFKDFFSFCDLNIFFKKNDLKILFKLFLILIGFKIF